VDADEAAIRLRGGAIDESKALYALGCNIGRQLGDLTCFKPDELDGIFRGMKAVLTHSELEVDLATHLPQAAEFFKARIEAETALVVEAGEKAIAAAAGEDGAIKTASGLVVKIVQEGKGEPPTATSKVRVHYEGRLTDGTIFDSSIKRGEPADFPLARVVPGWSEGLQLMKPGAKATLTIPPELGYGDRGKSVIPAKATLIFEVELLEVLESEPEAGGGLEVG